MNLKESLQARLSVQYPSKKLNKMLHRTYQNIGKALASIKNCHRMDCPAERNHIVEVIKCLKAGDWPMFY